MKAMVCEMCSGNDFLKDGDFYVCQSCGTKYTPDAAKKLMIEGTVDIKGTVQVDNSQFVQKQLENARRAYAKEDWEEVEKYYNLVEQNSRNNMEAVFFSSFGKAMLSLYDGDFFKREQKFKVLVNSMSVISDYYEETTENKEDVLRRINDAIQKMYTLQCVTNNTAFDVGSLSWQRNLLNAVKKAFATELNQISEKHNEPFILELRGGAKTNKNTSNKMNGDVQGRISEPGKSFGADFFANLLLILVAFLGALFLLVWVLL